MSEYAQWLADYRFPHAKPPRGPGKRKGRSGGARRMCNLTQIWHRDGGTQFEGEKFLECRYCGVVRRLCELTIDHVIPKSRGGKSNLRNYVAACKPCNDRKGNFLPEELPSHGW